MKYKVIENQIDFNDPEIGFSFESSDDIIVLSFIDWQNRKIVFRFDMVYSFSYRLANGYNELPEARMLEINDSNIISDLRNDSTASQEEELHHYIISTNEDEWCEIVAENYELNIAG